MLSTLPATIFTGSSIEPGFTTWEHHEPLFLFHSTPPREDDPVVVSPQPSNEPASSDSHNTEPISRLGSGGPGKTINLSSGLDELDRVDSKNIGSRSGATNRLGPDIDDRKRRRMISNRESARRSRMRKQEHLENMRNQANRLKFENQELKNRLRLIMYQTQLFCTENEYLRLEAVVLRQSLGDIRQVLLARQLLNPPCIKNQGLLPLNSLIA